MKLSVIVAVAHRNAIGRRGDLAFHISADLRRFKSLTMGKPVIMGRKTFESLPKGALPGRLNIVISRNADAVFPGAEKASSLAEAIEVARQSAAQEAFIIGGGQIYAEALPLADRPMVAAPAAGPTPGIMLTRMDGAMLPVVVAAS